MKQELEDLLCEHLGELKCLSDNTFYWIDKETILKKIDAVNLLLGTESTVKRLSWMERVMEAVKSTRE